MIGGLPDTISPDEAKPIEAHPIEDGLADDGRPARGQGAGGRERLCAVMRTVRPERDLVRFVAAPDGTVAPDLRARLPGRGVWVGLDRALVGEAVRRNVFSRALKRPLAGGDLPDLVGRLLKDAALGRLGLAVKAGQAVAGFAKVEAALRAGAPGLLHAAEAAADGRRKLRGAHGGRTPLVIDVFTGEELDLAMGRAHVIHAAVLPGPAGAGFLDAAVRYCRYMGVAGHAAEGEADRAAPIMHGPGTQEPRRDDTPSASTNRMPRQD